MFKSGYSWQKLYPNYTPTIPLTVMESIFNRNAFIVGR